MTRVDRCPTCGQKTVEYAHRLNKHLLRALARCAGASGWEPFNPSDYGLTHSELANWQKLRYWGLIRKHETIGGKWIPTPIARRFLAGDLALPLYAVTYLGQVVGTRTPDLKIYEVDPGYWKIDDYRAHARPGLQAPLWSPGPY